jgi:hypothetical protein
MKRFFVAVSFFFLPAYVSACDCGGGSPCRVLEETNAVFVGRALSNETISPEDQPGGGGRYSVKVTFAINESFRAVSGSLATVHTTHGSGSCGYQFEIGKEYLIFARNEDGLLSTSICSKTQPVSEAAALLKQFRAQASGKKPAAAFGVLFKSPKPLSDERRQPMPNVPVIATGPNGEKVATETDALGVYEFQDLPQGFVELRPILPTGLVTRESMGSDVSRVEAKPGTACENNFPIFSDGYIKGKILFAGDRSPSGMVQLLAFDPIPIGSFSTMLAPDGTYTLSVPWAGKYGLKLLGADGKYLCDLDFTFTAQESQKLANVVLQACTGPKK